MTDLAYQVFDVFTERAFGGNPLAVIPDARGLETGRMEAIAREFNFSETTFVLPPERAGHSARVRIFSPLSELPFAGHPIIGTALCLARQEGLFGAPLGDEMIFELGVGPLPCRIDRQARPWTARFTTDVPFQRMFDLPPDLIAACLSLPASAIRVVAHGPVMASKGLPYGLVELTDADALAACRADTAAFEAGEQRFPTGEGPLALAPYVRDGAGRVQMRMFDPLSGIPEDPATGSAAAALGGLLCEIGGAALTLEISQGVTMGRPSRILLEASAPAPGASRVEIGGAAMHVMTGLLHL